MDLLSFFQNLRQAGSQSKLNDLNMQISQAEAGKKLAALSGQSHLYGGVDPMAANGGKAPDGSAIMWNPQQAPTGNYSSQDASGNFTTQPIAGSSYAKSLVNSSPQDFDTQKAAWLKQSAPDQFLANDVSVAGLNQRLGTLGSGSGQGTAPAGLPKNWQTMLALDPTGKSLSELMMKSLEPTPDQKLIDYRDSLPPNDPRRATVEMFINHAGGLETDPNKIAETKASTAEKSAQTDLAKTRKDLLDSTKLSDDTLDRVYNGVLTGQKITDIVPNIGRGQQGAAQMTNIQNYLTQRMKADGMSQAGIAGRMVNLKAQSAAAQLAAKRGAGVDMGAIELETFGGQALEAANKFDNTNFVPWNKLVNMADESISDPKLAELKTAIAGVRGAYAQVLARNGVPTVDGAHKADELLSAATGPGALKATIAQMQREAAGVKSSSVAVQKGIQSAITGGPEAPPAAPATATLPPGMVKQVGTLKGKPVYEDAQGKKHVDMGG